MGAHCFFGAEGREEGAAHEFVLEEACGCGIALGSDIVQLALRADYIPCGVSKT